MEDGANPIERNTHARAAPLAHFRTQVHQQAFDIRPRDVGLLFENRMKDSPVFVHLVSLYDTTCCLGIVAPYPHRRNGYIIAFHSIAAKSSQRNGA